MNLEQLASPRDARDAIKRELGLDPSHPAPAVRAELMRAMVWSLAGPSSKTHVNRLLGAALPAWRLVDSQERGASDEALRGDLRAALSLLEDAGDLVQLSGGYWAPATTRLVHIPDTKAALLVGGAPSALLPLNRALVEYHGPYRHLPSVPAELAAGLPAEELEAWAGLPGVPLSDFAQDVLDSLERQPYAPTAPESFEFYAPASPPASRAAPQWKRWSTSVGDATGTMLARRTRVYGARESRLVNLKSGRITGICDLQGVDVRRLMYALESRGRQPGARATRARGARPRVGADERAATPRAADVRGARVAVDPGGASLRAPLVLHSQRRPRARHAACARDRHRQQP